MTCIAFSGPVACALPLALAVGEVDAAEDAAVEAEAYRVYTTKSLVVRLQPGRGPALLDAPSSGSVCDRDAADAKSRGESGAAADR